MLINIKENLDNLLEEIQTLSIYPKKVRVVCVTKRQNMEKLYALSELKVQDFGENLLQELKKKSSLLEGKIWHFLGQIQSNKLKKIVECSSYIHSVDKLSLIDKIENYAQEFNKTIKIFLQVNLTGEEQKAGLIKEEILPVLENIATKKFIDCIGFMTMTATTQIDEQKEETFTQLAELLDSYQKDFPQLQELSMGMSDDYQLALKQGATFLRLGTKILGSRDEN